MTLVQINLFIPQKHGQDQILSRSKIDYCTIDQVKQYLYYLDLNLHGISGDPDDEIRQTMSSVKSQVSGWCKTEYDYIRRLEWVDGKARDLIMLRFYPVVEVEYIRAYNIDYQQYFQYPGDEMIVNTRIGSVQFPPLYIISNPYKAIGATLSGFTFFPGKKNIGVVYTSGFMDNEIPIDFSDACAKWTAAQLLQIAELRLGEGMRQRVVSGVQETFGSYGQMAQVWKEEAKQALLRYRRVEIF
jgi:hypothetical protein